MIGAGATDQDASGKFPTDIDLESLSSNQRISACCVLPHCGILLEVVVSKCPMDS